MAVADFALPIPGLRLAFLDAKNQEILSDGGRLHFLIKLDELQHQHLMGRVYKSHSPDDPADVARVDSLNKETFLQIPWHLLGSFFYGAEPGQRTTNAENYIFRHLGKLIARHIRNNPYNRDFLPFLDSFVVPTSVQFAADPGTSLSPTPVVLALDVEFDGNNGRFYREYRRQVRSVRGRSFSKEVQPLRNSLGKMIERVEEKLAEQERIVRPMRQAVAHLHVGDILFQAAFDFREPLSVRKALWGGVPFDEKGTYTDPVPSLGQVSNVKALRGEWERMTDAGEKFVAYHASGDRLDPLTMPILAELRDPGAVWKRYFDERDTLHPAVRAELLQTIADALDCVILGTKSRDSIAGREAALIAEHVSLAFDSSKASAADAALVQELVSLDVASLLPPASKGSSLFDTFKESIAWLHETKGTASKSLEGLAMLNILTPVIVQRLRQRDSTGSAALAWIWRAAIGTGNLEGESLRKLQTKMIAYIQGSGKPPPGGLKIDSPIPARLASAVGFGTSFVALLSDLLALQTAYAEADKSQSDADAVAALAKGASAVNSTAKFAKVLAEALSKTLADKNASRWFSKVSKTGAKALPLVAICVEFLTFVASAVKSNEKDIFRTAQEQDSLDTAVWLDGLSILVTALGFAPQFAFLAVVFNVARFLVENPGVWIPVLSPELSAPTHPQLYLANHLDGMLKDKGFRELMLRIDGKAPAIPDTPANDASTFLDAAKKTEDSLRNAVAKSVPLFWGMGGRVTFGHDTNLDSIRILEKVYGFPKEASRRIVTGEGS